MSNTLAIFGLSWGDEGKGKFTDYFAQRADVVVRYNGGNNAGHTIKANGIKYKLKIMPSGAPLEKECVIANGCVVDPKVLLEEIDTLKKLKKKINLKLSSTAHVIFPFHNILDGLEETLKGKFSAGTTKRGIGPTYSDKVARWGLRIFDLINPEIMRPKLEQLYKIKKQLINIYDPSWDTDFNSIFEEYKSYGEQLKPYVIDTAYYLNNILDSGKKVVFEAAQGNLLGIDHGYYPFGTSSNSNALGISAGTGIPPKKINKIIGIIKAYTSRVGEGKFPTELINETAEQIREQGGEYGTVTGRPRRVGWLDLFNIKYGIM
ncbi:MAG: adenylosuccinate synthetase, partial [Candidatus Lokiarchaeota archaeon]|nr:adenylosuccinate synthetase [Candidatus Lokiarchaeota archaeon]